MKKIIPSLLTLTALAVLVGCSKKEEVPVVVETPPQASTLQAEVVSPSSTSTVSSEPPMASSVNIKASEVVVSPTQEQVDK